MNTATGDNPPVTPPTTKEKGLAAAAAAQDRKGFAVTLINVEGLCSYADAIMVVSSTSDRQSRAIGLGVEDALREQFGIKPLHREGEGSWFLVDFGDLLVHVFNEDTRAHYDLDQLWKDAPRIAVPAPQAQTLEATPSSLARRGNR